MNTQKLLSGIIAVSMLSAGSLFAQGSNNVTGGGFESWHNYSVSTPMPLSLTAPDGWHGSDSLVAGFTPLAGLAGVTLEPKQQIFETSDAHSGSKAVEIFSDFLGDTVGIAGGSLVNAAMSLDLNNLNMNNPGGLFSQLQFTGGETISGRVASVSAWMKNGDSAHADNYSIVATVYATIDDSSVVVGSGHLSVPPTLTSYTEQTVNITYTDSTATPDRLVVAISSSDAGNTTNTMHNSVKVDDVTYTMATTGIKVPLMTENAMIVYPVPARNKVYFSLKSSEQPSNFTLQITDITGKVMSRKQLTKQINSNNVTGWARGIYFYQLTNNQTHQQQRGKFILK